MLRAPYVLVAPDQIIAPPVINSMTMTLTDVPHWPIPWTPNSLLLPLAGYTVREGFPSPAEDFNTKRVDLTEELVIHP